LTVRAVVGICVRSAAVAVIPSTSTVVVSIVAEPITLPCFLLAQIQERLNAVIAADERTVQAFAIVAESKLLALARRSTTVALVPVAPSIVVAVVAIAISCIQTLPASALDRVDTGIAFWFVSAVQAGADLAVRHNGVRTAAIATVPITACIVVAIVAETISNPSSLLASPCC